MGRYWTNDYEGLNRRKEKMTNLLKQYVEANLVKQSGTWYSLGNDNLGQKNKAEVALKKLIEEGKIQKLDSLDESVSESDTKPPSMSTPEIDTGELRTVSKIATIPPKFNPALQTNQELPENLEELFKPLAADIGDIESRKKGGRFRVFVFGIDTRLMFSNQRKLDSRTKSVLDKVPYVFRYCDKKNNVRSGKKMMNEGWTVVSKETIKDNKRTGTKWLSVARDDTPDEDMYSVSNSVLCYADRGQYKRKKGKQNMEDILKTSLVSDARQETAEKMAKLSKTDPAASIQGYTSSNVADQAVAKETLEKNQKMGKREASEYFDTLNAMGSRDSDVDAEVQKLNDMVNSGQIGKTMKQTTAVTLDEI